MNKTTLLNIPNDANILLEKARAIETWVTHIRHTLHAIPELGMTEFKTRDKIIEYLSEIGMDYHTYENHTGIVASLIKDEHLPTIALRADIDGLPITELNDVSYKSTIDGNMHACGHDALTAILLGSDRLDKKRCRL